MDITSIDYCVSYCKLVTPSDQSELDYFRQLKVPPQFDFSVVSFKIILRKSKPINIHCNKLLNYLMLGQTLSEVKMETVKTHVRVSPVVRFHNVVM